MNLRRLVVRMLLLFFVVVPAPMVVLAQNQPSPAASPNAQSLKSEELDALVAPIALYPDNLTDFGLDGIDLPARARDGRSLGERE